MKFSIKTKFDKIVDVMSAEELAKLVEGRDADEIVGFVGVVCGGVQFYGITSKSHGMASALGDAVNVAVWWDDEWNEEDFSFLAH